MPVYARALLARVRMDTTDLWFCVVRRAAAAISSAANNRNRHKSDSLKRKKVRGHRIACDNTLVRAQLTRTGRAQSKKIDPKANIGCGGNRHHDKVSKWFRSLRDEKWFQTSIIGVIFMAGILVGIQTYDIQDQAVIDVTEYVRRATQAGAEGDRAWG